MGTSPYVVYPNRGSQPATQLSHHCIARDRMQLTVRLVSIVGCLLIASALLCDAFLCFNYPKCCHGKDTCGMLCPPCRDSRFLGYPYHRNFKGTPDAFSIINPDPFSNVDGVPFPSQPFIGDVGRR